MDDRELGGARPGRRRRLPAGRHQQGVVGKVACLVGLDDLGGRVDARAPGLEVDLEVLGRVVLDRPHQHLLLADLAAQVAGEGDAVVKGVALAGDHDDRALRVLGPELLGTGLAGDPVAEHHVSTCQLEILNPK